LLALAAGGFVLTKGKLLKGGKKIIDTTKGPFGAAVQGLGVGTLANVADKKLLQGKLTAYGIPLGAQTINGKPLTLNGTDALTYVAINGIKIPSKGNIITTLITLGVKKYFEAYDYIDPPAPGYNYSENSPQMSPLSMPSGGLVGR
jgi:hypothetical protein